LYKCDIYYYYYRAVTWHCTDSLWVGLGAGECRQSGSSMFSAASWCQSRR